MSKLAIVLCTVFFTSTANVSFETNTVESTHLSAQGVINRAFKNIEDTSEVIKIMGREVAEKLVNRTTDFNYKFMNEIIFIMTSFNNKISGMEVEDANIIECEQFSSELRKVAYTVVDSTFICSTEQLDIKLKVIDAVNKIFIDAFANLTEISEVSDHCGDNVRDLKSSYTAMSCNLLAAINATWISRNIDEMKPYWITGFEVLSNTIDLSFDNCKANNGYLNFYENSVAAIENTETCIQRIVSELKKTKATDVNSQPISLENLQRQMQQVIDDAFTRVQNESEIIQKTAQKTAEQLVNETNEFIKQFVEDTLHVVANSNVTGLFMNVENVNITDQCGQLFRRLVNNIINKTEKCALTQRDIRLKQIDNINKQFIQFNNLTEIRVNQKHCGDNVRDRESFYVAVSCIQSIALNATSFYEHTVELSPLVIMEFNMTLDGFERSLGICRDTEYFSVLNLQRQAVDIYENITTCINRMTREAAYDATEATLLF